MRVFFDGVACIKRVQLLASHDLRTTMKLAKLASDGAVTTATAHRLSEALQIGQSNSSLIRRNAMVNKEYNPGVTDA